MRGDGIIRVLEREDEAVRDGDADCQKSEPVLLVLGDMLGDRDCVPDDELAVTRKKKNM